MPFRRVRQEGEEGGRRGKGENGEDSKLNNSCHGHWDLGLVDLGLGACGDDSSPSPSPGPSPNLAFTKRPLPIGVVGA
jgi:hypothetical protein